MKVLLAAVNAKYIHSNLGIYSLKAYGEKMLAEQGFKREQIQIELAEYTINHQLEQILKDLYCRKPDVIGFSCYIWNISYIKCLLADIKKVLPEVKIWLGGPEVSYCGEEILREQPAADLVMKGRRRGNLCTAFTGSGGKGGIRSLLQWISGRNKTKGDSRTGIFGQSGQ